MDADRLVKISRGNILLKEYFQYVRKEDGVSYCSIKIDVSSTIKKKTKSI